MALTRLTKLQAINIILANSQLSPVESLASGDLDAEVAEQVLNESLLDVQQVGWNFNREVFKLSPDVNGFLYIPANALEADSKDTSKNVVIRGDRLYNKEENTYVFKDPLEIIMILALEFEELPQSARRYIALKASRVFQQRTLGDQVLNGYIGAEENTAWAELKNDDVRSKDYNHILGGDRSSRVVSRINPRNRNYFRGNK